jgi:hypothetical protein
MDGGKRQVLEYRGDGGRWARQRVAGWVTGVAYGALVPGVLVAAWDLVHLPLWMGHEVWNVIVGIATIMALVGFLCGVMLAALGRVAAGAVAVSLNVAAFFLVPGFVVGW